MNETNSRPGPPRPGGQEQAQTEEEKQPPIKCGTFQLEILSNAGRIAVSVGRTGSGTLCVKEIDWYFSIGTHAKDDCDESYPLRYHKELFDLGMARMRSWWDPI